MNGASSAVIRLGWQLRRVLTGARPIPAWINALLHVPASRERLMLASAPVLALLVAIFFAIRVWHGIRFMGFVDESEHLLGGLMLDNGAILYRTFVSQHGPVTFMFTQAYGALFGWKDPNHARFISAALALGAAGCVAGTPALAGRVARQWAFALFLGLTASVWLVQAIYMVNYHAIGGFLLVGALALFMLPCWYGIDPGRARAAVAGACCALVLGTAYSFGPGVVLLSASALWANAVGPRPVWRSFLAGAVVAGLGVLAWLLVFGDIVGYFAFHFAENQFVFSRYMTVTLGYFLNSLIPSAQRGTLVHAMALICCAASFSLVLLQTFLTRPVRWRLIGPIVLGFVGLLAQNARGGPLFQDGSFVVGSIGAFGVALPSLLGRIALARRPASIAAATLLVGGCIAGAELTCRHAVNSPFSQTRAQAMGVPRIYLGVSDAPEFARIRALVGPDERVLAVPYAPGLYLSAGRKPMDRYFYYLPWDAAYAQAPWFGQTHDLCTDLAKTPPRLIYFDHWKVWDRYDMRDYMPCFIAYLDAHYQRQADFPDLYLRRDDVAAPPKVP